MREFLLRSVLAEKTVSKRYFKQAHVHNGRTSAIVKDYYDTERAIFIVILKPYNKYSAFNLSFTNETVE